MKQEKLSDPNPMEVPLQIHRTGTLSLEGFMLNSYEPQPAGHQTDGYALAVLTKHPTNQHTLVAVPLEKDADGNYDLKLVHENSILMWTPVDGTKPDYGAIVEITPFELVYVPAESHKHAWEILDLDEE